MYTVKLSDHGRAPVALQPLNILYGSFLLLWVD